VISRLTAHGKAFVAGEYAVLDGRPALVLALDRGLHAELRMLSGRDVELLHRPSGAALQGELREGIAWAGGVPGELRFAARAAQLTARLCALEGREPRGFALAFEDELSASGRKLGLGGSAASCVLAVRACAAAYGRELEPREEIALAAAAHRAEQGGIGSGADVAASALGGLVEVRASPTWPDDPVALVHHPPIVAAAVAVPPDARFLLAFTGTSAATAPLVSEVLAFARARPARWRSLADAIAAQETALRSALENAAQDGSAAQREAALDAVRRGAAAMAALGAEANVRIVTPELEQACALASSSGAAAKPSGAGGGDCAIVLAFGDAAADRAAERISVAGLHVLRVRAG
jgi:phosphomevalonate kinase